MIRQIGREGFAVPHSTHPFSLRARSDRAELLQRAGDLFGRIQSGVPKRASNAFSLKDAADAQRQLRRARLRGKWFSVPSRGFRRAAHGVRFDRIREFSLFPEHLRCSMARMRAMRRSARIFRFTRSSLRTTSATSTAGYRATQQYLTQRIRASASVANALALEASAQLLELLHLLGRQPELVLCSSAPSLARQSCQRRFSAGVAAAAVGFKRPSPIPCKNLLETARQGIAQIFGHRLA